MEYSHSLVFERNQSNSFEEDYYSLIERINLDENKYIGVDVKYTEFFIEKEVNIWVEKLNEEILDKNIYFRISAINRKVEYNIIVIEKKENKIILFGQYANTINLESILIMTRDIKKVIINTREFLIKLIELNYDLSFETLIIIINDYSMLNLENFRNVKNLYIMFGNLVYKSKGVFEMIKNMFWLETLRIYDYFYDNQISKKIFEFLSLKKIFMYVSSRNTFINQVLLKHLERDIYEKEQKISEIFK